MVTRVIRLFKASNALPLGRVRCTGRLSRFVEVICRMGAAAEVRVLAEAKRYVWPMVCFVLMGCAAERNGESGDAPRLRVLVAASLTDVMVEVGAAYEEARGVHVDFHYGGSGALARQILSAPRGDVFLSASERWMTAVEEGERLVAGSRTRLFSNRLVMIANAQSDYFLNTPKDLKEGPFKLLAMGDPDYVPAGFYARVWLESLDVWSALEGRRLYTSDVRAVLAQVEARSDVLGVVYFTDYRSRGDKVRLLFEVPAEDGPAIAYEGGVIAGSAVPTEANAFLEFLKSAEAQAIFQKHGFSF